LTGRARSGSIVRREDEMKVLVLSPYADNIVAAIHAAGDTAIVTQEKIDAGDIGDARFLVSFGYRHILRKPILDLFDKRALNIHISALPFNRGAHPNAWAWIDGTPSGVTMHVIDEGIDTGPIVAQRIIPLDPERTLAETYSDLIREAEQMFAAYWPFIRTERYLTFPQFAGGSHHYARELPGTITSWHIKAGSLRRISDDDDTLRAATA
jgi:hypothetical protein